MPHMKSVAIVFGIGAGSRYEVQKHQGISHLIEHILFKGTNKRKSTLEISQVIEGIGGEINASTSKETTHLYTCLLYTSPSPRDRQKSRMPSSA